MSPAEQRAVIEAARRKVELAHPQDAVFGIPAPDLAALELQRPGGWTIIGWVQRHGAIEIESLLVCANEETRERRIKREWAPEDLLATIADNEATW